MSSYTLVQPFDHFLREKHERRQMVLIVKEGADKSIKRPTGEEFWKQGLILQK